MMASPVFQTVVMCWRAQRPGCSRQRADLRRFSEFKDMALVGARVRAPRGPLGPKTMLVAPGGGGTCCISRPAKKKGLLCPVRAGGLLAIFEKMMKFSCGVVLSEI